MARPKGSKNKPKSAIQPVQQPAVASKHRGRKPGSKNRPKTVRVAEKEQRATALARYRAEHFLVIADPNDSTKRIAFVRESTVDTHEGKAAYAEARTLAWKFNQPVVLIEMSAEAFHKFLDEHSYSRLRFSTPRDI